MINVNIRGVVVAIQAALPHLPEGGRIINIGSCLANRVAQPGIAVYAMTKSALNSLTRGWLVISAHEALPLILSIPAQRTVI